MALRAAAVVAANELRLNARRAAPWAVVALSAGNAALWWFGGPAVERGWVANGDFHAARLFAGFALFFTPLFTALLAGDPVVRDVEAGVSPLIASRPLPRGAYLAGKFAGTFATVALAYSAFAIALAVAQLAPPPGMATREPRVAIFAVAYAVFVLVPHFALAALVFTVGTVTMRPKLVFGTVVLAYGGYVALQMFVLKGAPAAARALFDPLAMNWVSERFERGKSLAEINAAAFAPDWVLFANRLAVVALGAGCLALLVWVDGRRSRRVAVAGRPAQTSGPDMRPHQVDAPSAERAGRSRWRVGQVAAALAVELRLLGRERALPVLAPAVVVLCGLVAAPQGGAFGGRLAALSSVYAANSARALALVLPALALFLAGELAGRDRAARLAPLVRSASAPLWVTTVSRFLAGTAAMAALAAATAVGVGLAQAIAGDAPLEPGVYALLYGAVAIPPAAFAVAAALGLHALARDRHLGHAACAALASAVAYFVYAGHRSWLLDPTLNGLWVYSDLTGLAPYGRGIALHRIYLAGLAAAMLAVAAAVPVRRGGRPGRGVVAAAAGGLLVAASAGALIVRETRGGPDGPRLEALSAAYERAFRPEFGGVTGIEFARADVRVRVDPESHRVHAAGVFTVANRGGEAARRILVTLPRRAEVSRIAVDGAREVAAGELGRVLELGAPLPPGGVAVLEAEWAIDLSRNLPSGSPGVVSFVEDGGVFLGGPDAGGWVPGVGYDRGLELADPAAREANGLGAREGLPASAPPGQDTPAAWWPHAQGFDLRAEIEVPAGYTAVTCGRLVSRIDGGGATTFVYATQDPVMAFPVLAARYEEARAGDVAVYFHPRHRLGAERLLDALVASRAVFTRDFGPLPADDLRVVEFPRVAAFAQSHETVIAVSEASEFLTRDTPGAVDGPFFVAAHETAHQWFGNLVVPGRAAGAMVLLEGLAEYAAGAAIEETLGPEAAARFRRHEAETLLRERALGGERPLAALDGTGPGEALLAYHKAGLALHGLELLVGKARMRTAVRAYVETFRDGRDRPTLDDFLAIVRDGCPDAPVEEFAHTVFRGPGLAAPALVAARAVTARGVVAVEADVWNRGDAHAVAPVEAIAADGSVLASALVVVPPGGRASARLVCTSAPARVVVDPRYDVLEADRDDNARAVETP